MNFGAALALLVLLAAGQYAKLDPILGQPDPGGPYTQAQRVAQYGAVVATRLKPYFAKTGVAYPPREITLVVLKQEMRLELYAQSDRTGYKFIRTYPILGTSGHLGPKLQEGDGQVPEGIYAVDSLNPNSHWHLSLHVNYPNEFDRAKAKADGRAQLGGEIMIHGNRYSDGCVPLGNEGAEDLFILASKVGLPHVRLLFCPLDFRLTKAEPGGTNLPRWTPELYAKLEKALGALPLPPATP